jgi:hypothetical protein
LEPKALKKGYRSLGIFYKRRILRAAPERRLAGPTRSAG